MMKTSFSRVVALSLLVSVSVPSWAQPPAPVAPEKPAAPPAPRKAVTSELLYKTMSSAEALATLGESVNRMANSKIGSGAVIMTQTSFKDGKVVFKNTIETTSAWITIPEGEDEVAKFSSNSTLTTTKGDKTTVKKFRFLDNGTKYYKVDEVKNLWSERDDDDDTPLPINASGLAWFCALTSFRAGNEITNEDKTVDGKDQTEVQDGINNKYVLDTASGDLISWTLTKGNSTIEFRWLPVPLDVPLTDSQFEWKAPEGAKLVAAQDMESDDQAEFAALTLAAFLDK